MSKKPLHEYARRDYILHVSIRDSSPLIWRKLSVSGDFTLWDLHQVLQIAFGWDDDHLHLFKIRSVRYVPPEILDDEDDELVKDEDEFTLDGLGLRTGQKFRYLYDFGDSWEHEITVSRILPADEEGGSLPVPVCLEGEMAAPFEDSGGIWSFMDKLEILKDPTHDEYNNIYDWFGNFDPERFDIEEINDNLKKVFTPEAPPDCPFI
jgi:hypothetical protein